MGAQQCWRIEADQLGHRTQGYLKLSLLGLDTGSSVKSSWRSEFWSAPNSIQRGQLICWSSHHRVDRATNIYVSVELQAYSQLKLTILHHLQVRLLPPEANDSDLHALGSRFGQVLSVRALMATSMVADPFTGNPIEIQTCKGVGFILFKSPDEAESAVTCLNAEGFEASFAKVCRLRHSKRGVTR